MKTFKKAFYLPLLFSILLFFSTSLYAVWQNHAAGQNYELDIDSSFTLLYGGSGTNVTGDFSATGNSILFVDDGSTPDLIHSHTSHKLVDANFSNATFTMGDARKNNSSSAVLNLPSYVVGSDIVWAGLFWQGHINETAIGNQTTAWVDADAANWNSITLKTPDNVMHPFTAPIGTNDNQHKTHHIGVRDNNNYRYFYGAFYNVTTEIQNSYSNTNNTFTVGNIKTTAGLETGSPVYMNNASPSPLWFNGRFGYYGGWSLIVVYSVDGSTAIANSVSMKNVSIYDGYDLFLTWGNDTVPFETTIDISGFYTPKSGAMDSKLLLYGGAGDKGINNDTLQIQNQNNVGTYTDLNNATNTAGQQFNHTHTILGVHMTPADSNKQGMDLDIFDVSSQMTNEQSNTKIKFGVVKVGAGGSGNCDQIFPQVLAFSTKLYEPKFCYDYAYEQDGIYFTEENDGNHDPKLTDINSSIGSIIPGKPIETTIFIRNLVDSDLDITNMVVNITDINTTQATYITDSTKLAKSGVLEPVEFTDATDLNASTDASGDYIRAIPVGDMSSNDNFYVYYSVDPKDIVQPLNMPIKVEATYDLVINATTTIPYTLRIAANVDMCSASNFNYQPAEDIFNIAHNNYYPHSDGNNYYNIPTQVTSRVANVKAISLDPDNLDTLKGSSAYVGIEMINAGKFHDVNASCSEAASSISPRVWVLFDNNSTSTSFNQTAIQNSAFVQNEITDLSVNPTDFYINAKQNAAYRISWNVDSNDSNIEFYKAPSGRVWLNNFPDRGGVCAVDMDNNTANTDNIQQFCGNAGYNGVDNASGLDAAEQAECLKCLYGINTRFVCSRDNFSIRPEAFMMHIDDQNQTNPTNPLTPPQRLTTNFTGVNQATANANIEDINITADYLYVLEINATNHVNNISSSGYTRSFNLATPNDKAEYLWEPRGLTSAQLAARNLACNDDANISLSLRFLNGKLDMNSSVNQVGEYRLHLLDTTWTAVDSNSTFMGHHTGSYFLSGLDCISGSTTQDTNSSVNNGCDINSTHINSEASLVYNDYNVTFHPYDINVTNTLTMGLDNRAVNIGVDFSNFVYMSNLNNIADRNMSVHLNTTIFPRGRHSNTSLSNFVTGCYAKPLDINITKSAPLNTSLVHRYVLYDINSTGDIINDNNISSFIPAGLPLNRDANLTTTDDFFQQDMNGVLTTRINLNFDRNQSVEANPEDINFSYITVTDPRTFFNAELKTNKTAEGNISINGTVGQNITHYYGRTAARKTRIVCDANPCVSGQNGEPDVLIYYEAYCYLVTNNNTCDRTLLPTLTGRYIQKVDSRWYVNLNHTDSGDGNLTATQEVAGFVTVPNITNLNIYTKNSAHSYNMGNGLPYEADMNSSVPRWLIYDEDNATATTNKHKVIFQSATTWTGEHETNTTTKTEKVRRVNRRTMW